MRNYLFAVLILAIVLISGCIEDGDGESESYALKSFTSPSGDQFTGPRVSTFEPVSLETDGQNTHLALQFKLFEKPVRAKKIKLTFKEMKLTDLGGVEYGIPNGDGLEYISGPFSKFGDEYYLFLEQERIPPEDTLQSFTVKVTKKGLHYAVLTSLDENDEFLEAQRVIICVEDTAEKAMEMCMDPGCQTEECIRERSRVEPTRVD